MSEPVKKERKKEKKVLTTVSVSFNAVTGCTLHNGNILKW